MSAVPGFVEEGVITVIPGTAVRAKRYSTREKVPLLERANARQVGAAGFWYVGVDSTWDKIKDSLALKAQTVVDAASAAAEATGADNGVLGVIAKALGIPFPLLIVLLALVAFTFAKNFSLVKE